MRKLYKKLLFSPSVLQSTLKFNFNVLKTLSTLVYMTVEYQSASEYLYRLDEYYQFPNFISIKNQGGEA